MRLFRSQPGRPVSRCLGLTALCLVGFIGCTRPSLEDGHWVDLTHAFSAQTLYWPTSEPFRLSPVFDGETTGGFHYAANRYQAAEHGGTHMDAPIHFLAGGDPVERVGLDRTIGPLVVVDVTAKVSENRDYAAGPSDFEAHQSRLGPIPSGAIVLIRTGYERFWPLAERYLGTSERGADAVSRLHFPGLSEAGSRWLVAKGIRAVGVDTASIDPGPSTRFDSHRCLAAAGIPIFENLRGLAEIPQRGAFLVALPMKIEGGSGAPLRAVAWVPDR